MSGKRTVKKRGSLKGIAEVYSHIYIYIYIIYYNYYNFIL
jgi:hypothetical protein